MSEEKCKGGVIHPIYSTPPSCMRNTVSQISHLPVYPSSSFSEKTRNGGVLKARAMSELHRIRNSNGVVWDYSLTCTQPATFDPPTALGLALSTC